VTDHCFLPCGGALSSMRLLHETHRTCQNARCRARSGVDQFIGLFSKTSQALALTVRGREETLKARWMLIGGAVLSIVGVVGLLRAYTGDKPCLAQCRDRNLQRSHQRRSCRQGTPEVGVRHAETVHCGEGLSYRGARHRLLQRWRRRAAPCTAAMTTSATVSQAAGAETLLSAIRAMGWQTP
jgi:hypothetical protein